MSLSDAIGGPEPSSSFLASYALQGEKHPGGIRYLVRWLCALGFTNFPGATGLAETIANGTRAGAGSPIAADREPLADRRSCGRRYINNVHQPPEPFDLCASP